MKKTMDDAPAGLESMTEEGPEMLRGKRFIWLMVPPWDNVWTRQNHFTTRLTRLGAEVLYVELPFAAKTLFRDGQIKRSFWPSGGRFQQQGPGLTVLKCPPLLPGGLHFDSIAQLNARLLGRRIRNWVEDQGWTEYTCWCRVPMAELFLSQLKPSRVYYDITDDYKHFYNHPRIIENIDRREKRLVERCTKIFYTASSLATLENLQGRPAFLLPNGVDYELFAQAASPDLPIHPQINQLKKPTIGYVGLTSKWTDFELLEKLGRRFPDQILMVGPIHPDVEAKAKSIHGVAWTGFVKERSDLPRFIKGFDVCIMPFLVNHLTHHMNPLKVWEYLATGKPFVSVDLQGLGEARTLIDVATNHDEFLQMVEARLAGESAERTHARRRTAEQFSWDALFQKLLIHLELNSWRRSLA